LDYPEADNARSNVAWLVNLQGLKARQVRFMLVRNNQFDQDPGKGRALRARNHILRGVC
jgi:hypothetical protein